MIRLFTLAFFAFVFSNVSAQVNHEFGVFFGGANYHGDLVQLPTKWKETRPAAGIFYRQNINSYIGIKYALTFGSISGADSNYSDNHERVKRNLSFTSPIYEASVQVVFNARSFDPGNSDEDIMLTPFIAMGVGYFHFDPQAKVNGTTYHLQKYPTELDKPKYKLNDICVPISVGLKMTISESICLSAEYGFRKTFTDYLDDVSDKYAVYGDVAVVYGADVALLTDRSRELSPEYNYQKVNDPKSVTHRGDPTNFDSYIFAGISLSYCFEVGTRGWTPRVNYKRRTYRYIGR